MIRTLPGVKHPMLDTMDQHNRRVDLRLHIKQQDQNRQADFYEVKLQDYQDNRVRLQDYNMRKDIEEINQYLSLKQHVEYYEYRYGLYLGRNVDITV